MNAKIMRDLFKVRPELEGMLNPEEEILGFKKPYLFRHKYGLVRCKIQTLMTGTTITLNHALDKKAYLIAWFKDKMPKKSKQYEIVDIIPNNSRQVIIKNKYGLLKVYIPDLFKCDNHDIRAAVDKTKYWLNYLADRRKLDYDYSKVIYRAKKAKVEIVCSKHGSFFQFPDSHEKGHGCIHCGKDTLFIKVIDRLHLVKKLHKDKYTYDIDESKTLGDHINIYCPLHGKFKQKFTTHAVGAGCPSCANISRRMGIFKTGLEDAEKIDSSLYIIKFSSEDEVFYKVGITTSLKKRLNDYGKTAYEKEVISHQPYNLVDASILENRILREFSSFKYTPKKHFAGYTECLSINPLYYINYSLEEELKKDLAMCEYVGVEYEYYC
jgi:hypothetical protein